MSAPGQPAAPPPTDAQPAAEPQAPQSSDPWSSALEGVDEVYRPHVEQAINPLREQFTPRLELADRLGPLGDYADDLLALHGMADDDGNALEDFLGFAAMASQVDPSNPDSEANQAFAQWWEQIGDSLGLFGDDEGGEDDGEDPDDDGGGNPETAELRELVGQLQQQIQGLESGSRVANVQQEITQTLDAQIKQHMGEEKVADEQTRNRILTLARAYEDRSDISNRQMIELAVKDYLELTGQGQRELLNGSQVETVPGTRSPGNGSPDLRPEDIATGNPEESRRRAKAAALSRLRG